jgi:hypothetical protein
MIESNVEELNDADLRALPKAVALIPEEVQQVAGGSIRDQIEDAIRHPTGPHNPPSP